MGIWQRWLDSREETAIAVVGAGFIGRGTIHRLARSPRMVPALLVNRNVENGLSAFEAAGVDASRAVVSDDPDELAAAIASKTPALTTSPDVVTSLDAIDIVVEATGALDYGAKVVLDSLAAGKHVISMNAELDATIGPLLHQKAREAGAIYTISDGDQPGVMLRQVEFVESMGFEIAAAINCKRIQDVYQNPDVSRQYATRDSTSLIMTTAFGDGTKMQIENAVVANSTGLVPDVRGMHGVETDVQNAARDITAVLSRRGVVEYTLGGDFGGGIGVVGHSDDAEMVHPYMRYSKMGDGPDYFFFRPYHLLHFELPTTIAEVVLDGQGIGPPVDRPVADVVTIAKKDLAAGEPLDGIGGFSCYGHIDTVENARGLLPIGLAEHARMVRPVRRDDPVSMDDVEIDESQHIVQLRASQEASIGVTSA